MNVNVKTAGNSAARHIFFEKPPWNRFADFIEPKNNRGMILGEILDELNFHFSVVQMGGSRHFFVSSEGKQRPCRVLVAHYDSITGCAGANDNASSVFILICAARILFEKRNFPWMIIFTDNEELAGNRGIRAQGSYLLGKALKNTDLYGASFFVFDSCGCGDTLIISTSADLLLKKETGSSVAKKQKNFMDLRNTALLAAEHSSLQNYMLLPAPFSDDVGFLHAGLAAQMVTMLPANEAAGFAQLSRANPKYIQALINRDLQEELDMNALPATWRVLNSSGDTEDKLTPEHFQSIIKYAITLATP
ncbi:MAG: Zn-dependent exopeptidase M28 [Spirochaetaceae bacterium]|nr:Zn-dependent exopeptidase M28 [Spirochaetaceae bacterium]GMO15234.1 MAG: M28 family peptidase [Termitinemataceae bacterium]